jgi:hypothetical protein
MIRRLLAVAIVVAFAVPAMAEDKFDAKKIKGSWLREIQGTKILFQFKDDGKMTTKLTPAGADKPITVISDITIDKDGALSGVITEIEQNGNDGGPTKGDKYTFKIEVGKETVTISDFKGVGDENVKQIIEGEYKKQTD